MIAPFATDDVAALLVEFDGTGPQDAAAAADLCATIEAWLQSDDARSADVDDLARIRADLWFMQGMLSHAAGDLDGGIHLLQQSIKRSEQIGYTRRQILGLRSIAVCFENAGMQADSTRSIFEALDLAEHFGEDMTLALVSHALTALYQAQGAYGQMVESAKRTADYADRSADEVMMIRAYSGIGIALAYDGRPDEGFAWIERASVIAADGHYDDIQSLLELNHMFLLQRVGRIDEALAYADQNADTVALLPSAHAAAVSVIMAEVYLSAGKLDRAEQMLTQADSVEQSGQLTVHLIAYYSAAGSLYEAKGDAARALEMMKQCVKVTSQIQGTEAQARLVALERYFARELAAKTEEIHHLRTVELVEKNHQLSDLVHQKDEILHVVAHDLRNPLAAAQLLGESLMIDLQETVDEDEFERLVSIRDAATEMRNTIDTLLQSGEPEAVRNPSSASDAVQASVRVAMKRYTGHAVTLTESSEDVELIVDAALLRRSVDDLLWNAIETANAPGVVDVRVVSTGQGARITMTGTDVRFDQQAAGGRSLYIARRLIERMNGSLTVSPFVEGKAQTATIDLRG